MTTLEKALSLAQYAGFHVYPVSVELLSDGSKKVIPHVGSWKEDSTNDLNVINSWDWTGNRRIGIDNTKSGILLLDLDDHGDGKNGFKSLSEALLEVPETPLSYTSSSGRGEHYYYARPDDSWGSTSDLITPDGVKLPGVDVKAYGGSTFYNGPVLTAPLVLPEAPKWTYKERRNIDVSSLSDEALEQWLDDPSVAKRPDTDDYREARKLARKIPTEGLGNDKLVNHLRYVVLKSIDGGRRKIYEIARKRYLQSYQSPEDKSACEKYGQAFDKAYSTIIPYWTSPAGIAEIQKVENDALAAEFAAIPGMANLAELLADDYTPPQSDVWARTDGNHLFYKGKVHSLFGQSESGKSLLAQRVCVDHMQAGENVLYLDFEDTPGNVLGRMQAMGATKAQIARHLLYVNPQTTEAGAMVPDALETMLKHKPAFTVIDGVTAALSSVRMNGNDGGDYSRWHNALADHIAAKTGSTVVVVDHVNKGSSDANGRFATGTQAKLSVLTGAGYEVRVKKPFSQGTAGEVELWVSKDRPGAVRAFAGPANAHRQQQAATVLVDSTGDDGLNITVNPQGNAVPVIVRSAHGPLLDQFMEETGVDLFLTERLAVVLQVLTEVKGNEYFTLNQIFSELTDLSPKDKIYKSTVKRSLTAPRVIKEPSNERWKVDPAWSQPEKVSNAVSYVIDGVLNPQEE